MWLALEQETSVEVLGAIAHVTAEDREAENETHYTLCSKMKSCNSMI